MLSRWNSVGDNSWSDMREILEAISQYSGKTDGNVQEIARKALSGSRTYSIDEFELDFTFGRIKATPPNGSVCYIGRATFDAIRNPGSEDEDAAFSCTATMDVQGRVLSVSCELVAG
jgi:hypothetical protein